MNQLKNLKHEISQNNITTICENRQNFNTDDNKENITLQENSNKLQNDMNEFEIQNKKLNIELTEFKSRYKEINNDLEQQMDEGFRLRTEVNELLQNEKQAKLALTDLIASTGLTINVDEMSMVDIITAIHKGLSERDRTRPVSGEPTFNGDKNVSIEAEDGARRNSSCPDSINESKLVTYREREMAPPQASLLDEVSLNTALEQPGDHYDNEYEQDSAQIAVANRSTNDLENVHQEHINVIPEIPIDSIGAAASAVANQGEIDGLKQPVARVQSADIHLTEQLTASTAEHEYAVKHSSSLSDELESIRVAFESCETELKQEIIDLKCLMDEKDAMIVELHTTLERQTSEHDQLKLHNSALIDQLNSNVERAAEYRAELESMENATVELREDKCRLANELAARTQELRESVMDFLVLSDEFEVDKHQHVVSEARLTRDNAELYTTLAEKQNKIIDLHKNLQQSKKREDRTNELQTMCNAYSVDLSRKVSEIDRLSGENASLMLQDETRAGVIQALEIDLQQRLEDLARLTDQLSDLNSRLSNTQLEHEHTLNELNTRLSTSAELTETLSIENTELKRQIDELASRDKR